MVEVNLVELGMAASWFKTINGEVKGALSTLVAVLNTCGGSAGTDTVGKGWADKFDPAAEAVISAATACVQGTGQMNDLLLVTQQNHAAANTASTIGEDPGALAFPAGTLETFDEPTIPAFYGGASDAPFWWGTISSYVEGRVWPNGHQDKLRAAGEAFKHASGLFYLAATKVPNARPLVEAQKSDEIEQILTQTAIVEAELKSVAQQLRFLGLACNDYATALDDAHSKILDELEEFAAWFIAFEAAGWAAASFTAGTSAAAGTAAAGARAAITGSRIARICDTLVTAAEASALPTLSAVGNSARTVAALQPLIVARMSLWASEVQGLALSRQILELNPWTRVTLRVGVQDAVRGAAPKKTVNGQEYYVSATDSNVLVPVAEKYNDPRILSLPKDERGWYYVDAASGLKYPVDPKPVFGHDFSHEWHAIRDRAIKEGWTRQRLIDYCNDPKLYRIEDAPGNWSHRFEKPK